MKVVTKAGLLSMQVCVPWDLSDDDAKDFLESEHPCGTTNGWFMRKDGDEALAGDAERVQCLDESANCHIMFDA